MKLAEAASSVWLVFIAVGCSSSAPIEPPPTPSTPPEPDLAPAPDGDAPDGDAPATPEPTAAASSAPSPSLPPPVLEKRFLPHETACSSDADCAVTTTGVDERFFCCDSCGAVAGTKAWVARAEALCVAYEKGSTLHPCPPRDCGPPGPARCAAGRCEIAP